MTMIAHTGNGVAGGGDGTGDGEGTGTTDTETPSTLIVPVPPAWPAAQMSVLRSTTTIHQTNPIVVLLKQTTHARFPH